MNNAGSVVSITGMGVISPSGMGISSLWQACLNKSSLIQDGLGSISHEVLEQAKGKILSSGRIKKTPNILSKSLVMSLYSIISALDEAGWKDLTDDDAIIIGTTTGQIGVWEKEMLSFSNGATPTAASFEDLGKQPLFTLPEDIKEALGFAGRIMILSSACSASTQALILAQQLLQSQRVKRVLAGGVEELGQLTVSGFGCLKLLNANPCKPFDQNRTGINLSEGAAFYTLEVNTQERSLAHLLAGDTVLDSYHMTSPNPEGAGLQKAILSALSRSQLNPEAISFVHAHGTGSSHNDQAEANALHALFTHRPRVISTKGVHGHALGASGALELGICLEILKQQLIPAITGLENIDANISLNLPMESCEQKVNYLLKTTLGFGGINSALILKAAHA